MYNKLNLFISNNYYKYKIFIDLIHQLEIDLLIKALGIEIEDFSYTYAGENFGLEIDTCNENIEIYFTKYNKEYILQLINQLETQFHINKFDIEYITNTCKNIVVNNITKVDLKDDLFKINDRDSETIKNLYNNLLLEWDKIEAIKERREKLLTSQQGRYYYIKEDEPTIFKEIKEEDIDNIQNEAIYDIKKDVLNKFIILNSVQLNYTRSSYRTNNGYISVIKIEYIKANNFTRYIMLNFPECYNIEECLYFVDKSNLISEDKYII